MRIHAGPDPDPGYTGTLKTEILSKSTNNVKFIENKVAIHIFIPITLFFFILFMPNYLSFCREYYIAETSTKLRVKRKTAGFEAMKI
jgi:hypothetical protein